MAIPAEVLTSLQDSLAVVLYIGTAVMVIYVALMAFESMRHALGFGPDRVTRRERAKINYEATRDKLAILREEAQARNASPYVVAPGVWVNPNAGVPMSDAESTKESWKSQEMASMQSEKRWINPNFNPNYQFTDEDREAAAARGARGKD